MMGIRRDQCIKVALKDEVCHVCVRRKRKRCVNELVINMYEVMIGKAEGLHLKHQVQIILSHV